MKSMKSKVFILITLGLIFTSSCEEYLEEKTFNQMTPERVFETPGNAQLAIDGLYPEYFKFALGINMFWPAFWMTANQEFSFYGENTSSDLRWYADH